MNYKKLNRKEKEKLYREEMIKLQRHWGNPIDPKEDWEFVSEWTDEQLDQGLAQTVGQVKFEKFWGKVGLLVKVAFLSFVVFGVIGLLLFGVRQLF